MRNVENVSSALGITHIRQVDISQVLHASEADTYTLRSRLRSWNVPKFNSYPLLLRALTHPSISNWAERILKLPKRSLGPNTLEVLGDRVVGVTTARHILTCLQDPSQAPPLDWTGGARMVVGTMVRNRGLAATSRAIGIESLLRWEKSVPPASHRPRLNREGIDIATGMQSNVEINGLAAAYESVSAAIYLDGGFQPARDFNISTLFARARDVQFENRESPDIEMALSRELVGLFGAPISFVTDSFLQKRPRFPTYERVQARVLDMQQEPSETVNEAHTLFYSAVSLRRVNAENPNVEEEDIIALSSHFSVQTARLAALNQAISILRGEYDPHEQYSSGLHEERMHFRNTDGTKSPGLSAMFDDTGRWCHDGDYTHTAGVLSRAGLVGFEDIAQRSSSDIQTTLREKREVREREEELFFEKAEKSGVPTECGSRLDADVRDGDFPRLVSGNANIDLDLVNECLVAGEHVDHTSVLAKTYGAIVRDVASSEEVCTALDETTSILSRVDRRRRSRLIAGFHALGAQTMGLWAVQRSIKDVSQDRAEVVPLYERRLNLKEEMEPVMLGRSGLAMVRDGMVRKLFVALGICVERLGTSTALRWLSGAEAKMLDPGIRQDSAGHPQD